MKRKLTLFLALASITAVAVAGIAGAAVTFDSSTGSGFVGKGDVQTAFNLNNAKMQAAHQGVTFKYVASATYEFECEWWTGPDHNRHYHSTTKTRETAINAGIASDSRKTGQWTGWNLTGFSGGAPGSVGGPEDIDCPTNPNGNEMKTLVPGSVQLVSQSGGLYAVLDGVEKLIYSN